MTTRKKQDWKNRIVGYDEKPASWFVAHESNWRIHPKNQQDALLGALDSVGWVQDVIVNQRSSPEWGADQNVETLVDGHLRVMLALRRGDETPIPVKFVDLTPNEERLVLAMLDPISAMAAADKEKLAELLRQTQLDDARVTAMLAELAEKEGLQYRQSADCSADDAYQLERAAELQAKWQTAPGEIWQVGPHRLACGDNQDPALIKRLLGGITCDGIITDPPYDLDAPRIGEALFGFAPRVVLLCGGKLAYDCARLTGWEYHLDLIWKHRQPRSFATPYQPVMYHNNIVMLTHAGSKLGWKRPTPGFGSVIELPPGIVEYVDREHGRGKCIEIFEILLQGFEWQTCADPYLGTGASLLACERLGITGYGIEIDPGITAIALERLLAAGLEVSRA